jgi:hypothetical protein
MWLHPERRFEWHPKKFVKSIPSNEGQVAVIPVFEGSPLAVQLLL